jgi:putative tricarboxylic transport membrane protein
MVNKLGGSNVLKQDRVAGVIILLICTGLFYVGWDYPTESKAFPLGLLIFLMIGAVIMIARPSKALEKEQGDNKKVYLTVILCVAYVSLVDFIGYFVVTALFMIGFMAMMGLRSIRLYIAVIIGINLGLYLLFVWQLKVPIPKGTLFEWL